MNCGASSSRILGSSLNPEGDIPHNLHVDSGPRHSTDTHPIMQGDEQSAAVDSNTSPVDLRLFQCPIPGCSKSYRDDEGLKKHDRKFHQAKTHICPKPDCSRSFATKAGAHNHNMFMHKVEGMAKEDGDLGANEMPVGDMNAGYTADAAEEPKPEQKKKRKRPSRARQMVELEIFKCPVEDCGVDFLGEPELDAHQVGAHGVVLCGSRECFFQSQNMEGMAVHRQETHHSASEELGQKKKQQMDSANHGNFRGSARTSVKLNNHQSLSGPAALIQPLEAIRKGQNYRNIQGEVRRSSGPIGSSETVDGMALSGFTSPHAKLTEDLLRGKQDIIKQVSFERTNTDYQLPQQITVTPKAPIKPVQKVAGARRLDSVNVSDHVSQREAATTEAGSKLHYQPPRRPTHPSARLAEHSAPVASRLPPRKRVNFGVRKFANMDHGKDEEELRPLPRRFRPQPSDSPEPSITSSTPPTPTDGGRRRKSTTPEQIDKNYTPDMSDSDMSMGPEDLRVPKHTFATAANSAAMHPDSFLRFPAKATPVKVVKKPKTIYSIYTHNPADDEENIERGRYLGKDRKIGRRIESFFVANGKEEPAIEFNSHKPGALSWIMRERLYNVNAGAGNADEGAIEGVNEGTNEGTDEGADAAEGPPSGVKRKRANCSGPDRVKRSYVWRDGGKRASEAGVRKKVEEHKAKGGDMGYKRAPKGKRAKRVSAKVEVMEDDEEEYMSPDDGNDEDEYMPRGGGHGGSGGGSAAITV